MYKVTDSDKLSKFFCKREERLKGGTAHFLVLYNRFLLILYLDYELHTQKKKTV